jgi:hypothetical protein
MTDESEPLSRLQALSQKATFNNWLSLQVAAAMPGEVELRLPWRPEFAQYHGPVDIRECEPHYFTFAVGDMARTLLRIEIAKHWRAIFWGT